jgi:Fe-S cluster assembly ATPase SufC
MLMDWQNPYSKNGYTTKNYLHVQHNSHQKPDDIHHRFNPKVHFETQKTTNSQDNTDQNKECWRYLNTQIQTILQSHSTKNSMVLAQKQIWRPVQ